MVERAAHRLNAPPDRNMDPQCVFCRIVAGEILAALVYEDDAVVAFRDVQPQAPLHVLVVPREHLASLNDLSDGQVDLAGRLLTAIPRVADRVGVRQEGYRVIVNTGRNAGQTVHHLHFHVLGGRPLGEGLL